MNECEDQAPMFTRNMWVIRQAALLKLRVAGRNPCSYFQVRTEKGKEYSAACYCIDRNGL